MHSPQHILITGASSGLGAALALAYAAPDIRLSLHGRDGVRLARIAGDARRRGSVVAPFQGDVTDAPGLKAWIEACDSQQPLDLVIANAGISLGTAHGSESADRAQAIFATNVAGVLNTLHPAIPFMKARRRGQLAIMSSLAGFRGFPGAPAYCASKAAARVYGEALRGELALYGVAVNVICPGFVKTPMTDVNPFPMPLLMSAERAAEIIRKGLARNQARIAFPLRSYGLVRVLAALPQIWIDAIAARTPRK